MNISEVTINRRHLPDGRVGVLAAASLVIDGSLKIYGLKLIRLDTGRVILAMPNKRVEDRCPECNGPTPRGDRFCGACGARQATYRPARIDVVHTISHAARLEVEDAVFSAYEAALGRDEPDGEGEAA